jgi:hypothetical protein
VRGLTARELVELWDRGTHAGPASRALAVLAVADGDRAGHGALTCGARDARLLAVRALTLGQRMAVVTACPACGVRVELEFTAADIGLGGDLPEGVAAEREIGGHTLLLRPATADDLVAVEREPGPAEAAARLLERCVVSIDGERGAAPPPGLVEAIEDALESLDAAATPEIVTTCPDCAHRWSAWFDASAFFWDEIQALVPRLLADVAVLARHYHWSEREILSMPAVRRQFYLEAIGS